jgi:AbrB family looped-hinge helix DNA binding protein
MQKIVRVGNSKGVTIPKAFVDRLGLREGSLVDVQMRGDSLVVKPTKKPKYTLAELLSQLPEGFRDDTTEIDFGADVGEEIIDYKMEKEVNEKRPAGKG